MISYYLWNLQFRGALNKKHPLVYKNSIATDVWAQVCTNEMHPMSLSGKQVCFIAQVRTIPDLWSVSLVAVC